MNINQYPNAETLNHALAHFLVQQIEETLLTADRFTIALSGGSTPKAFYQLLASEYKHLVPWQKLHVFFDDERYVPFADERNNARMIFESLLNHVPIPPQQVHIMHTDIPANESASLYEKLLHEYFDGQPFTFDMVLLGMGDDGHTLSLFPGTDVVHEQSAWAASVLLNDERNDRITITAPVVNLAKLVVFMVTGKGKAATLKKVLNGPFQPDVLPSQVIKPANGKLYWFIDEAAGDMLYN